MHPGVCKKLGQGQDADQKALSGLKVSKERPDASLISTHKAKTEETETDEVRQRYRD
jgi:hypothetical protein